MQRKIIIWTFLMMVCAQLAWAAMIHGTIYDSNLEVLPDVLVEIDTKPRQQLIAKDGTYAFNVPVGNYSIKAQRKTDNVTVASDVDYIEVVQEGDYVLDMILFPDFSEVEDILAQDIEVDLDVLEEPSRAGVYILIAALIIIAFFIYLKWRQRAPKEESELQPYIDYIKKHKRVTQKEMRKEFPDSEAKISLILTELEEKGIVKKIKKGRGNVILLK